METGNSSTKKTFSNMDKRFFDALMSWFFTRIHLELQYITKLPWKHFICVDIPADVPHGVT